MPGSSRPVRPPVSELAAASIADVVRNLPEASLIEALAFHDWLRGRLADLRGLPLSFTDADIPAGRVHQALRQCQRPGGNRGQLPPDG
jgi:hypothetical protein